MIGYNELLWAISFPVFCSVAMWFSIDLALLVRAECGRQRRATVREAIAKMEQREETVPVLVRISSKAVVRRAVVVVGGDFARSPRMQYHATSLSRCGVFDEVVLVGFDMGNHLSEALQHAGDGSCPVSTKYLIPPFVPPSWLRRALPERRLYWIAATVYRVCAYIVIFTGLIMRASAMRVSGSGQLLLTDIILVQAPPTVPVVPLIKFIARPCVFISNMILYYGFVVPASWMMSDALKEIRDGLRLQQELRLCPLGLGSNGSTGSLGESNSSFDNNNNSENNNNNNNHHHHHHYRHHRYNQHSYPQRKRSKEGATAKAQPPRWVMCPALVVDWHNFGYTILSSDARPVIAVWIYRFFEFYMSRGDWNITVSKAMQAVLLHLRNGKRKKESPSMQRMNANMTSKSPNDGPCNDVVVMYDTAPEFFGPVPRSRFVRDVLLPAVRFKKQSPDRNSHISKCDTEAVGISAPPSWILNEAMRLDDDEDYDYNDTIKETLSYNDTNENTKRGIFIIGSTSWTADDDYTIVVDALVRLDKRMQQAATTTTPPEPKNRQPVRPVWFLMTGKGETRGRFEDAITAAHLSPLVTVTTMYFQSYQHYAMALGAADVGLCVHHSSSGLDLPMKAVDMLGSGLPVIALRYPALGELLNEQSGWVFSNAAELEDILCHQIIGLDQSECVLREKRRHVLRNRETWENNWRSSVLPVLRLLL